MSDQYRYGQWVDRIVAKAPPLSPDQRDRIAAIFRLSAEDAASTPVDPDFDELRELGHE